MLCSSNTRSFVYSFFYISNNMFRFFYIKQTVHCICLSPYIDHIYALFETIFLTGSFCQYTFLTNHLLNIILTNHLLNNSSWLIFELIKALDINTSIVFRLVFLDY